MNCGCYTIDCEGAEMWSRNQEMFTAKCELQTVTYDSWIEASQPLSQELLGVIFASLWTPLEPLGSRWDAFESFLTNLGSLLDRLKEARGQQPDFGYRNMISWIVLESKIEAKLGRGSNRKLNPFWALIYN